MYHAAGVEGSLSPSEFLAVLFSFCMGKDTTGKFKEDFDKFHSDLWKSSSRPPIAAAACQFF